ncbi:MAG: hypothetical protein AAF848_01255 [Pseudomonadota bacterium]
MPESADPIAVLSVSAPRRYFAAGVQAALGLVLILVAAQLPAPTPIGVFVLLIFGGLALWASITMFRATQRAIILSRDALIDSEGEVIALLTDISSVDSGFFAFKPSNGFLLRLSAPAPRRWVPGVWWRMGTRVGIGGATNGKAARDMANIITILLQDPGAGLPPAQDRPPQ